MALPSIDRKWLKGGIRQKPKLYVLEVRPRLDPSNEPIAWILVEREDSLEGGSDHLPHSASLRLNYETVESAHSSVRRSGYFCGGYSRGYGGGPMVSLTSTDTSKGAVFLDLPGLEGQRIGTYLFNEIVTWAKQWPDATVLPIELLSNQAYEGNTERRNRFYEQFGIDFDYLDATRAEGLSRPMLASSLVPTDEWKKNIAELNVREYFSGLIYESVQNQLDLRRLDTANKELLAEIRAAKQRPLRWAFRQLWMSFSLVKPIAFLVLGTLTWLALKSVSS